MTEISEVFNASISKPPAVALISTASVPVPADDRFNLKAPAPVASIVTDSPSTSTSTPPSISISVGAFITVIPASAVLLPMY